MNFRQARSEYLRLRHAYRSGQIPPDEFEKQVNTMIVRSKGQIWIIGVKTGKWYRRDEKRWVEDVPEIIDEETPSTLQSGSSNRNDRKGKDRSMSVYSKKTGETAQEKSFRQLTVGFSIAFIVLLVVFILAGLMLKGVVTAPSAISSILGLDSTASDENSGLGGTNIGEERTSLSAYLISPAEGVVANTENTSIKGYLYSSRILGKWLLRDTSIETLVVKKNGSIRLLSTVNNFDYTGTYSFIDDHTILLNTDAGIAQAEIWIDAGVLTLIIDDFPLVYDRMD